MGFANRKDATVYEEIAHQHLRQVHVWGGSAPHSQRHVKKSRPIKGSAFWFLLLILGTFVVKKLERSYCILYRIIHINKLRDTGDLQHIAHGSRQTCQLEVFLPVGG
jgi:hypothetical protein